jgi:hypothetical protein
MQSQHSLQNISPVPWTEILPDEDLAALGLSRGEVCAAELLRFKSGHFVCRLKAGRSWRILKGFDSPDVLEPQVYALLRRYEIPTLSLHGCTRQALLLEELVNSRLSAEQKKTLDDLRTAEGRRSAEGAVSSSASRLAGLSLTDEQRKKLADLKAAAIDALTPLFRNSSDTENMRAIGPLLQQYQKDTNDVLTAEQKAKLSQPVRAPDGKLPN